MPDPRGPLFVNLTIVAGAGLVSLRSGRCCHGRGVGGGPGGGGGGGGRRRVGCGRGGGLRRSAGHRRGSRQQIVDESLEVLGSRLDVLGNHYTT